MRNISFLHIDTPILNTAKVLSDHPLNIQYDHDEDTDSALGDVRLIKRTYTHTRPNLSLQR